MRKLKLYLETSVWNFVFADDAPHERDITKDFFELVRQGLYEIFISKTVIDEINDAPELKKKQLITLVKQFTPINLEITEDARELAVFYADRGIVPRKKTADALHVAVAVVAELDAVVTWNYEHLANLRKAELFHGLSLEKGYFKKVAMITPMEVSKI